MGDESKRITEAQRVALRLVAQGYESKEIARRLGVGHHAIDKRIERAVRVMGATDRKEAARMLAIDESSTYERTAYEPSDLGFPPSDAIVTPSDGAGATAYPWPWLNSRRGRILTKKERVLWALIGLPVIIMLAWGIFLSGVGALDALKL